MGANLALRRPPGSTCRDHGECWGVRCEELGPAKGQHERSLLPVESELLSKLSVPAHFVALNGDTLNINLKTGSEVSGSGLGWGGGPRVTPNVCLPLQRGLLSPSERGAPLLTPAFSLAPLLLQRTSCIEVVSQDKTWFPNLTDVREVVTDQFLCSGTENDDHPCRGEPPAPVPGILAGRPRALVRAEQLSQRLCPFFLQENLEARFSLSGDSGFFR